MHKPVLLDKAIKYLNPKPGGNFVDCTIGEAGHALALLEKVKPGGRVLGIDVDFVSLKRIKSQMGLILAHGNFRNIKSIIQEHNLAPINGILFDLGLSSWQIEKSGRGFTFKKDEPLIMILDGSQEVTAQEIINTWPEESLINTLKTFGEERYARKIVQAIINQRKVAPIKTTFQLKETIRRAIPLAKTGRGSLNRVLARIFQALRIVINDELENLKQGLHQAVEIVAPKGKIVVISFHSIEDRFVKNFFRDLERENKIEILTKKPETADEIEIGINPRSRSAKLRAAMRC